MGLYRFTNLYNFNDSPRTGRGIQQPDPHINNHPLGMSQSAHVQGGRNTNWDGIQTPNEDVEEFVQPGFRYLDQAMKNYWSDIRVPTRDAVRFVKVKVAGANKGLQIWIDDLKNGRAQLPVLSVSRGSHTWNADKFSPPYINLRSRFVNPDRTRVAKDFRPVPYIVNYNLTIWAEHKRDAENALYQMLIRFNPMAIFRASDEHWVGNIEMKMGDVNDTSDKEANAEEYAKVRYEIPIIAEAWLALPSQVIPTVLGNVTNIGERVDRLDRLF